MEVGDTERSIQGKKFNELNMDESKILTESEQVTENNRWTILSFIQEQMSCFIPKTPVVRSEDGKEVCVKKYHLCNFAESGCCDCLCDDIMGCECCGGLSKKQTFSLSSEECDRDEVLKLYENRKDGSVIKYYPCSCVSCCNCYWSRGKMASVPTGNTAPINCCSYCFCCLQNECCASGCRCFPCSEENSATQNEQESAAESLTSNPEELELAHKPVYRNRRRKQICRNKINPIHQQTAQLLTIHQSNSSDEKSTPNKSN